MNYFAHGWRFVDQPYVLAGTALPDWLSVIDRSIRLRPRLVEPHLTAADPLIAAVAAGVQSHHDDDAWFHATPAFFELSTALTASVRAVAPDDRGFRASFLGHVLVELLLDAELIAAAPQRLDSYYQSLAAIDAERVCQAVERMTGRRPERLPEFIRAFLRERFLSDYADDAKLVVRLDQVMRRVGLPPLPPDLLTIVPAARRAVATRARELMASTVATG